MLAKAIVTALSHLPTVHNRVVNVAMGHAFIFWEKNSPPFQSQEGLGDHHGRLHSFISGELSTTLLPLPLALRRQRYTLHFDVAPLLTAVDSLTCTRAGLQPCSPANRQARKQAGSQDRQARKQAGSQYRQAGIYNRPFAFRLACIPLSTLRPAFLFILRSLQARS